MSEQSGDKSQDATPHRRRQAREEGQVAKSQDLSSAVVLIGALMALMFLGGDLIQFIGSLTLSQFTNGAWLSMDQNTFLKLWSDLAYGLAGVLLPLLGTILFLAIASNVLQIGFILAPKKLMPDLQKISPIKGLERMFSMTSVARLGFGIVKILVIAVVAAVSLYAEREQVLALATLELGQIGVYMIETMLWTSLKIGAALLILAILDYAFQRWKHEQDLKMTTQEVREEMKNLQGDPQVAARRRAVQRQLAQARISGAVPQADVVITNPTELAVAIKYEFNTMRAPVVVAKGAGVLAARIRRLALENGITIVEKKPLAQALYRDVEVNQPVPEDQYAAVAEVLAYVYQLQGKAMPTSLPTGKAA